MKYKQLFASSVTFTFVFLMLFSLCITKVHGQEEEEDYSGHQDSDYYDRDYEDLEDDFSGDYNYSYSYQDYNEEAEESELDYIPELISQPQDFETRGRWICLNQPDRSSRLSFQPAFDVVWVYVCGTTSFP